MGEIFSKTVKKIKGKQINVCPAQFNELFMVKLFRIILIK